MSKWKYHKLLKFVKNEMDLLKSKNIYLKNNIDVLIFLNKKML